jgi:single-strand DNA-binding protein
MQIATIAGNLGKDAQYKTTERGEFCSFSVAVPTGWGDRKTTTWWDVTRWGKGAEGLSKILTKGAKVTCVGEISQREHDGKTYLQLRADHVEPQGSSGGSSGATSGGSTTNGGTSRQHNASGYQSDLDDDVPFLSMTGEW